MDKRIEKFIGRHHVMTIATIDGNGEAWCCSVFYTYLPETIELVFTSSETTMHARHMSTHCTVAASIVLESRVVGRLQGLQITGTVRQAQEHREAFLKAFPYAVFSLKEIWSLTIKTAKYTDNTLGFGTKLYYE